MEQQPVRRRRRRRRTARAQSETVAWLTYILSLARRAYHWLTLLIILGLILAIGLGAPIQFLDHMFLWWGHW